MDKKSLAHPQDDTPVRPRPHTRGGVFSGGFPGHMANPRDGRHRFLCPFRCRVGADLCVSGSLLRKKAPPHESAGLGGGQARLGLPGFPELAVAGLVGGQGQLGPALDAALGVDPLDVGPDRERRDEEASRRSPGSSVRDPAAGRP
ncbi:MAG: hypothetical protein MZV63_64660 [Marinilabiliales bacterium]|nr:hypothetical protein [Marinilabiliales bacterium]